jgi:CDP-diacylglycerol--glycerol-3-phosphate 3-phosphatidyltransferase
VTTKTQRSGRILPRKWIDIVLQSLESTAALLVKLKFTPNTVTMLALFAGIAAGYCFATGRPLAAALFILLSGVFDILDGKVAKHRNQSSKFGAIFDSTLDRYSEFALYLGLAYYFREHWALWVTFFTFLGSTMVSYTRARAEGLGIECKVGIMHRAERMVIMAAAGLVGHFFDIFDPVMIGVLILIAVVSNVTAWQRTFYVRKVEKRGQSPFSS